PVVDNFEFTPAVLAEVRAARNVTDIDGTRAVDLDDIRARTEFEVGGPNDLDMPFRGQGTSRVEIGELDGETVFLKTSSVVVGDNREGIRVRAEPQVINESRMSQLLEELGLGPRHYGVTTDIVDGQRRYVFVNEYVEGEHFSRLMRHVDLQVTPSMIADIRIAGQRLLAAGIDVRDPQFRLTPDGRAVLIDPEYFTFGTPGQTNAVERMEAVAEQLEAIMLTQRAN
ncbi:MAG: hypothetical protein AAF202_13910, partial [Pseudomonadota bacterium]